MATIYEKLKAYSDSDYYGFHMPGHKRKMHMSWNADPYTVDITEIEGFDDLLEIHYSLILFHFYCFSFLFKFSINKYFLITNN